MPFPQSFLFGAATSSHQIEGNLRNNWTDWEKSEKRLEQLKKDGKDSADYISGNASYHAQNIQEDVEIMKNLNLQAYRFSIEWSRIEPQEGVIDPKGLEFYDTLLTHLRAKNITPFVTLWHWSVPVWMEEKGGILSPQFPEYFQKYIDVLLPLLQKHNVEHIITLNEPLVFTEAAYRQENWPQSRFTFYKAVWNLIRTHKKLYTQIHALYAAVGKSAQVGIAKHNIYFHTETNKLIDKIKVFCGRYSWNEFFLSRISNHQDFIGINYYC